MKRAKLLIIALLCFAGFQQAAAQSDIELTDSISNEWDGDTGGGGIIPSMPSNPVTSLTMSQTSITIMGGERYKLTAKTNSDAGNKRVIWSIADKSIAFLGSDGVIRGLKTGKTTVTASSVSNPEITASCSVTVTSDYVAPESGWILPWGKDEAWDMSYLYFEQSKYREPALDKNGNNWKELNYDDTKWKTITGPMGSPEVDYAPFNYVWKGENNCFCLRRKFTLPSIDDGKYTFSTLHDDGVVFYLNGKEIINEENWSEKNIRNYTISADNFVEGENILSIYIKQGTGDAYLDYALYYEHDGKPSDRFDIGFLPDVSFEFFYDATLYNETTQSIPNHEAAKLAGYNLKLSANIPTFKENYLSIGSRCEGYIDKWEKNSTESGEYFFRTGTDCMTIVCRVKPKINTNNASDLISNRGGGHNYMFRVGNHNSFFLHTGTAYEESRAINLSEYDGSQVLAVRVDGVNNYIQLDNFTTGESKKISGVNWGSDNNIMKFFYNDNKEYYTGDVYWMYYSKKYVADKDLRGLISYGLRKNYNITYIVDGEIYKVERLEEGTPITPITPHKEGYTFNGWSGLPQIMPARDITVTGNFTANTYNLIYMLDGKEYKKLSVKFGEKITPETAPNKEGYTFSGWNGLPETMPAKDITVTGSFAANYYDLIYMVDGKEYKRVSVKYGENITPEMALTKEGHTFSGWSEIPETMPAKDVTITGTFTVNTYNLIYMLDGKEYKRVSVRYGEIIVPVEGPTKDGHTFSGWKGLPETMPARDVTVTGSFVANYYDLIYMVDGKEYKRVSIKFGETITPETAPTKEGHTFSGWSEIPETMPAKDVTVTGKFTVNTYKLTYVVDGKVYKTVSMKYGETITPETAPNKEGHTFSGWNGLPTIMPARDVTVTGSFVANYYDLIYMVDGKEYKRVSIKFGETITPETAPDKEGYTFSGWSGLPQTMPAKDVRVTGSFTINTYKLTYVVDGKVYKTVSMKYGETITPETAPNKEGHTFSGWNGLPTIMPARDVTVTGKLAANYYDLIYMVDGKEYKRVSIKFGETITPETAPTKEGHTFSGWSEIPETMPAKDVTVTGKFTVNTYKLTYVVDGKVYKTVSMKYGETITPETAPNKEGHTFSGWNGLPTIMPARDVTVTGKLAANYYDLIYMVDGKEYKRVSIKFGETITPETAPDKEGYTFSGWSGLPQTMPAKDVRVTGSFTINTYKLTYMVDGEVYKTVSMKYGETITPEPEPTKEGYIFSGWNGIPTTMPAKDIIVTGTFGTALSYNITYIVDGEVYATGKAVYGEKIQLIEEPTKEGHTFSGWSEVPETMPARDITVTGTFTVNTYKITYMVDGEVYKTVDVKYGENITAVEEPTKEGYSFSGWKGLPETMPAKNVTATGKFVANYYDLIYMVDGKEHKRVSIKFGETIAPETAPDKEGHTFSGWNGLPATMPAKDITVTGTFTVNTYKITYMVDSAVYKTVSVKYGETIVPIEDPTKEGHTFNGWKGKDLDKVKKPIDIAGNADKMLYSNAYCTMPGDEFIGWHVLFDNDPNTFFHSEWNPTKNSTDGLDHYLRVDLGVGNEIEQFSFTYTNRGNLSNGAPKTIVIEGSNIADGAYTEITTLTDLPGGKADVYKSDVIGNGNKYRFIRFRVTETQMNQKNNEHPFFYMSEFGMAEYADFIPETMPARDITVTGSFTVNTYNLVYMVDDKVYETITYTYGEKITPIEEPTKEGFIFSGWNGIPTTMPAKDIIVTGTFGTALSYNITYIVDGEVYATGKAVYGEKIQLIEEPTKEGHTFSGWSEVPETMPAGDITVTGTFTINTYKITYMVDGEVYKTVDVKYGENITAIEGPTKEGHTFSGWSEVPETMPAKDITVTGSYTVNTYKITYKVDGVVYQTISLKYGETIVPIENLTKDGHTFSGWKREDDVNRPIDIDGNADNMLYSNAYCTMPLDEFIGWHVLFDNDPNTFFHSEWNSMNNSTDGLEHYLRVDLGVGNEIEKFSFTYTNRGNLSDAAPKTMVIEGSNMADGAYTEITTLTDLLGGKADVYKSDVIGNGNKYRFIRFRVTETQRNLIYNEHPFFYISEFGMTEHADFIPETMPAKDITVTGSFTVNTYNLIYMLDGKEYKRIPVKYGETITPETAPTKEGHSFSGWSGLPQTMPARDVTVTGEFTVNTYKLTYVVDNEVYKTVSIKYGETITPEAEPTKEGHTFSGWSEVPETMPAGDITVTGKFTVNTYKLTYVVGRTVYKTVSVKYGETITPEPEPTKEGHSFSGWSGLPQTMPARDVTVTGEFTVNTYKLTYVVDNEVYKTVSVKYGETITPEPEPTKEGHSFSGWSGLPQTMPARDVTVTGEFIVNTYKLTYMVDGEVYATVDVKYGETITAIEEPTKEGYTFSGWDGLPTTMPAKDITVTGTFTVNTYKITYMVDGEVYTTANVKYGETIIPIEEPTKEGYTFSGWDGLPTTMPAKDITVIGTFKVNTYKITYMVDGEVYTTANVKYGETIIPIEEPTKEGYTFSGWDGLPTTMPAKDITVIGTFKVNTYKITYMVDGEVYTTANVKYGETIIPIEEPTKEGHTFSGWSEVPETMPARDITVTGTFTVNYYNVIYIVDGEVYETVSTAYGDEIVLIDEPTKDGYKFSGWSEAPDRMPAEDVVITGSFEYTNIVSPTTKSVVDVYSLQGVLLHKGVEDLNSIPKGLYIINGKKVFIK